MKNKYEIRGDVTAIFLNHQGKIFETIIDTIDLDKVTAFPNMWSIQKSISGTLYAVGKITISYKKIKCIRLHRLISDVTDVNVFVDHFNHNGLDNRRSSNLRKATIGQNNQNLKERGRVNNNSCGVRGVTYDAAKGKWIAQVRLNGKYVYSGNFDKQEDAEIAVREARAVHLPYSIEAATIVVKDPSKYINYREKPFRNNKSGYRHITWNKYKETWRVEIKKLKITRSFEELTDAIAARDALLNGQKVPIRRRRNYSLNVAGGG